MRREPTPLIAAQIAALYSGSEPASMRRFTTGIGHWVYDIRAASGEPFVVRIGASDQAEDFAGAAHWSGTLRPLGVPLPALLARGSCQELPYIVLERLAGDDLGAVYDSLTPEQQRSIARNVEHAQRRVSDLGEAAGFGFARLPTSPLRASWHAVIEESLARSRSRIEQAQLVSPRVVELVAHRLPRFARYFSAQRPTPFLDDATTKNVIVHEGALSGIVDVDWLCYGDPLFTVTSEQQAALRLYTALFCADFLSELGQSFNRAAPEVAVSGLEHVERLLAEELVDC